jgi:galactokinase
MSAPAADLKARLYQRCMTQLDAHQEIHGFYVPGRIELLGKHTDYAGGRSLLCTLERGVIILACPRADARVRVTDAVSGETRQLTIAAGQQAVTDDWSNYVATVLRRVARNFPEATRGADMAVASDLPPASGMSSSSALVVAIFLALSAGNDLANNARYRAVIDSPETLAMYLAAIENGQSLNALEGDAGAGTLGGSEDHTAILCCRAGFLSQYAFCPVRLERMIPFPAAYTLVVAFSGVAAQKTGNALAGYNNAAAAARRILDLWNEATKRADATLALALSSERGASRRIRRLLEVARKTDAAAQRLIDRFEQFVMESQTIVPQAGDAIASMRLDVLGELVEASQIAAETGLRNQIPETMALVRLARQAGAVAASAFGAGFGGSVWALVAATDASPFVSAWQAAYQQAHPAPAARAEFIVTRPGPPVVRLAAGAA